MERTKKLKKLKNIFFWLSLLIWIGTALTFVILALMKSNTQVSVDSPEYISKDLKNLILGASTTVIIAMAGAILIKDRIRNTIWMSSLVLGLILYGTTAVYITLGLWAIDEYVIYFLYKSFKNKYIINKEIDRR